MMWKKLELSSSFGSARWQQLMKSDGWLLPESAGVPVLSEKPTSTACQVASDCFSWAQLIGFFWMISSHLCLCERAKTCVLTTSSCFSTSIWIYLDITTVMRPPDSVVLLLLELLQYQFYSKLAWKQWDVRFSLACPTYNNNNHYMSVK